MYKLALRNISLNEYIKTNAFLTEYEPDHILLLPKLQELHSKHEVVMEVVLTCMAELRSPIDFDLLAQICFMMNEVKTSVKV